MVSGNIRIHGKMMLIAGLSIASEDILDTDTVQPRRLVLLRGAGFDFHVYGGIYFDVVSQSFHLARRQFQLPS